MFGELAVKSWIVHSSPNWMESWFGRPISLVACRRLVIKVVARSDTQLREGEWNSPEARKSFGGKLDVATVTSHSTVVLLRR